MRSDSLLCKSSQFPSVCHTSLSPAIPTISFPTFSISSTFYPGDRNEQTNKQTNKQKRLWTTRKDWESLTDQRRQEDGAVNEVPCLGAWNGKKDLSVKTSQLHIKTVESLLINSGYQCQFPSLTNVLWWCWKTLAMWGDWARGVREYPVLTAPFLQI